MVPIKEQITNISNELQTIGLTTETELFFYDILRKNDKVTSIKILVNIAKRMNNMQIKENWESYFATDDSPLIKKLLNIKIKPFLENEKIFSNQIIINIITDIKNFFNKIN